MISSIHNTHILRIFFTKYIALLLTIVINRDIMRHLIVSFLSIGGVE